MAYEQLRHHIFKAASHLEFHGDIRSYLFRHRMQPRQPIESFHAVLLNLKRAFPEEMEQRPVVLMVFEAYTQELKQRYLLRYLNPA